MQMYVLAAAIALAASGCATTDTARNSDERVEREYVTGSNIPKKGKGTAEAGVTSYDKDAVQRARDSAYQAPRPGLGAGGG